MFQNREQAGSSSSGDSMCRMHKESYLMPILVSVGPSLCDHLNDFVAAFVSLL